VAVGQGLALSLFCGSCTSNATLGVNADDDSTAYGFANAISGFCLGIGELDCQTTAIVNVNADGGQGPGSGESFAYGVGSSVSMFNVGSAEANSTTTVEATNGGTAIGLNGTSAVIGCGGGGCQTQSDVTVTSNNDSMAIGTGDAFAYDCYGCTATSTTSVETDGDDSLGIGISRAQSGICDLCNSDSTAIVEALDGSQVKAVSLSSAGSVSGGGCDDCQATTVTNAWGDNESESIALGNSMAGDCADCTAQTVVTTNSGSNGNVGGTAVGIGSSNVSNCDTNADEACGAATVLAVDSSTGNDGIAFSASGNATTGSWVLVVNTGNGQSIALGNSNNADGDTQVAIGVGTSANTDDCAGQWTSCTTDGPTAQTFVGTADQQ
jgi:hypothetical protein